MGTGFIRLVIIKQNVQIDVFQYFTLCCKMVDLVLSKQNWVFKTVYLKMISDQEVSLNTEM